MDASPQDWLLNDLVHSTGPGLVFYDPVVLFHPWLAIHLAVDAHLRHAILEKGLLISQM